MKRKTYQIEVGDKRLNPEMSLSDAWHWAVLISASTHSTVGVIEVNPEPRYRVRLRLEELAARGMA